ncbi:MAG: DUF5060 domain-containing protein [Chitinivibrionales bacterium]|nr:DUF5060 domain-containing protein [Chitinivibrionales bacterium]
MEIGRFARFEETISGPRGGTDVSTSVGLDVVFLAPDGRQFAWWGFHDGSRGWRLRFMPDQIGTWQWRARFSDSSGETGGTFVCVESDLPGVLGPDRDNPIWFGYSGGTHAVVRSLHAGDRFFADKPNSITGESWSPRARTRFLDWVASHGYTMLSVGSHYLNRDSDGRGKGWNTPKLWDPVRHRPAPDEYRRMEAVLDECAARGIVVYPFAGMFGQDAVFPLDHEMQERFVRYTMARLAPFWNIVYNVAGPEPLLKPKSFHHAMAAADVNRLGTLIARLDPFGHPVSIHNQNGDDPFRNESWTGFATLQGGKGANWHGIHAWLLKNHTGTKPVYAQECLWSGNKYHEELTDDQIRSKAYVYLLSATTINFADNDGNSSTGFSGTLEPDLRNERRHAIIKEAWDLLDSLPFWTMAPHPDLVSGGICLANPGHDYLVYLPEGGTVDITVVKELEYTVRWIDPRAPGAIVDETVVTEGAGLMPPGEGDWLVHLSAR